jgi:phosphoribosylformimino-5-aminoimidazole carboxamide ribotide isomerase
MLILPAIDLYNGKCVRLHRGDFDSQVVYSDSPAEVARSCGAAGLRLLHVVDLEGAKDGRSRNWDGIASILSVEGIGAQVGGGIRSADDIQKLLDAGARRVVVGSVAVQAPQLVARWIHKFGAERIVVALDVRNGSIAVAGWQEQTDLPPIILVRKMVDLGVRSFLCTDIDRDGTLSGPNVELYEGMHSAFPSIELIGSGGIASLEDIEASERAGCSAVVVGKALYKGRLSLDLLSTYQSSNKRP